MFESARVKLTFMYLGIIMLISGVFSLAIYRIVTGEIEQRFGVIQRRIRASDEFLASNLRDAKKIVLLRLVYANGVIFVASGVSGYFLARKTMQPIEQAMEKQRRFIGDASHELGTPLSAMRVSIEVALREKKLSLRTARETLGESLGDIANLESLVAGLISVSRMEEGGAIRQEMEVSRVIRGVIKKMKPLVMKKGVKVKTDLQKISFYGRVEDIEKIVTILVDNAIKYSDEKGEITVAVGKSRKGFVIEVADCGIGITQEELPHIFDRFYRAESSRYRVDGFGLGLSLAKRIAEESGGRIEVASKPGRGSSFKVFLKKG